MHIVFCIHLHGATAAANYSPIGSRYGSSEYGGLVGMVGIAGRGWTGIAGGSLGITDEGRISGTV